MANVRFKKKESDFRNQTLVLPYAHIEEEEPDEDYKFFGQAEVASIYQSEAEREQNRPRRQAVPNPALEQDMKRYRLKIERKFQESAVNAKFKMPLVAEQPKQRRVPELGHVHTNINS